MLKQFERAILDVDLDRIRQPSAIPTSFHLAREGALTTCYIPFDSINREARVVVLGITPGFTQWKNAVREAQGQLRAGASADAVLRASKLAGVFSGPIRPNLVALLDAIHVHQWLNIASCASIFGADNHLVHITSILRHPVFLRGANYNGTPDMTKSPFLRQQVLDYVSEDLSALPDAMIVPLGPKVSAGLQWLASEGVVSQDRILSGLPHPSGANMERISYFLGRKQASTLSGKTNAAQLDAARTHLQARIRSLKMGSVPI